MSRGASREAPVDNECFFNFAYETSYANFEVQAHRLRHSGDERACQQALRAKHLWTMSVLLCFALLCFALHCIARLIVEPTFVQILTTSNPEIAGLGTQAYFIDAKGGVGVDRSSGIGRFG